MSVSCQHRCSVVTEPREYLNPNDRETTIPYAPSLDGSAASSFLSSPAPMPYLDRHVAFHPIVRHMPPFGSAQEDLSDSESLSLTSSRHDPRKRRLRIAKTTLSLPLSFSSDWLFFDHPVLSPTYNDSQHEAYEGRWRESEDEQFTPSPPLKLKISLPSLTRRPSRRELRLQDAERIRRWREATGGKLKSCLKAPAASACDGPSTSGIRVETTNVGIAFCTKSKIFPMPPSTHSHPICDASVATYHLSGEQVAINVPVLEDGPFQFVPSTPNLTANRIHCLPDLQLSHDDTQKKTFEESGKVHSGRFNRLTKKTSRLRLQLRFFTPKPSCLESSSNVPAGRAGVDDREVVEDLKSDLEPLIPASPWTSNLTLSCARHESDAEQSSKIPNTSSLGKKSTPDSQEYMIADDPVTPMSECLDLLRAEDAMKDRLPAQSHCYHQDPRNTSQAGKVPLLGTDPFGATSKSELPRASFKSKSSEQRKKHKHNLRPCCENCLEATLKGSDPDHEIPFSPRALEIYRAHASGDDKVNVSERNPVKTGGFSAEQLLSDEIDFSPKLTS